MILLGDTPPPGLQAGLRFCRVCGCDDYHACEGGCFWLSDTDDLCSACQLAEGHTVRMTRAYRKKHVRSGSDVPHTAFSVATCKCGWTNTTPARHFRKQDRLVRSHWQAVVAEDAP